MSDYQQYIFFFNTPDYHQNVEKNFFRIVGKPGMNTIFTSSFNPGLSTLWKIK
jgi:hypothetical protein